MSGAPKWARLLIRLLAPKGAGDDLVGDLEEADRRRRDTHASPVAGLLTGVDALDTVLALLRVRVATFNTQLGTFVQDYKFAYRMLVKYPGLTIAGGLALALAIGIGAGWYDLSRDLLRPVIPLPAGDRIVEVEMRNSATGQDERRLLHDFLSWRDHVPQIEALGAYRTLEKNLVLQDSAEIGFEPVTVAETSASAFRVAPVAPLLGRPLIEADEAPGAPSVVVIGYSVWQRQFGGRSDIVGRSIRLGDDPATVVGVMPEGFAFPINHRMWVPLRLRRAGYAPLEGPAVRVFGRLPPGTTQAQAYAAVTALTEREATESPATHQYLRPRVLAYGGESPGDRPGVEMLLTHVPIVLVLLIACVNVGTLMYARTATREAEIATRSALGASRGRIIAQLFIEALVLAACAAAFGLLVSNAALKWGLDAYYAGQEGQLPFWLHPGLKPITILYATALTLAGAGILGIVPAFKATGGHAQAQLKNLGSGGSTLRFGWFWTAAMIVQVALTVTCIPPALGIAQEALRDRQIRSRFPAEQYLAVRVDIDQRVDEGPAAFGHRRELAYREFEHRISQQPGVRAVTFGDRLPGMNVVVHRAEFEPSPGGSLVSIGTLWTTSTGPRFFESFGVPVVQGREFDDVERESRAHVVVVNEAFARQYCDGRSPVGRRLRFLGLDAQGQQEPWLLVIGMVRDIGMTPTDLGEAAYAYTPASPAATDPLVVGIRVSGDATAFAPAVRRLAAEVDPGLRLDEVRSLDSAALRIDVPQMVAAGAVVFVVLLGLFLSAAGIFSLMSVNVARRTREIGLRAALGASPGRLLFGVFLQALTLVGAGVVTGNAVLLLVVVLSPEIEFSQVRDALAATSIIMLSVGLAACVVPARRALGIEAADALRVTT